MNPEAAPHRQPSLVHGDYRLTRVRDGIKVEVLDYHAEPLVLTDDIWMRLRVREDES